MDEDQSQPLRFNTMAEVVEWCRRAPQGTRLEARALGEALDHLMDDDEASGPKEAVDPSPEDHLTWREKLWRVPGETRINVEQLAEALDRPTSFIYKRTSSDEIPHRKLFGVLVFRVGEIRTWIRENEEVHASVPMSSTSEERRLHTPKLAG